MVRVKVRVIGRVRLSYSLIRRNRNPNLDPNFNSARLTLTLTC
jgi:hypothetical protein